jgi:hypothetical protein
MPPLRCPPGTFAKAALVFTGPPFNNRGSPCPGSGFKNNTGVSILIIFPVVGVFYYYSGLNHIFKT